MAPMIRLSYRTTAAELEERAEAEARRSGGLVGIAITLALLTIALFLVQRLHHVSRVEDCMLSGRSNCDALLSTQR